MREQMRVFVETGSWKGTGQRVITEEEGEETGAVTLEVPTPVLLLTPGPVPSGNGVELLVLLVLALLLLLEEKDALTHWAVRLPMS